MAIATRLSDAIECVSTALASSRRTQVELLMPQPIHQSTDPAIQPSSLAISAGFSAFHLHFPSLTP